MTDPGEVLTNTVADQPQLAVWLTHLWQRRIEHSRLGLVLGAGVSRDAGIPTWTDLVRRLMESAHFPEDRMQHHKNDGLTETLLAEMVYRRHSDAEAKAHLAMPTKFRRYQVESSWREKIHNCLYKAIAGKQFSEITKDHLYLRPLAELIYKSGFSVTFNFDDIVDEAVMGYAGEREKGTNPEIITQPALEMRKGAAVIYHINGILPREELRRSSEHILLTEDAFADILLSPNSQDAEFVINQFALRTFLLLGVSLSDNSLKNLLRSGAKRNPANHHFIIYHEEEESPRSKDVRADLFDANLHVYNLISIFLTTKEIKAFIEVLNLEEENSKFEDELRKLTKSRIDRKYYLVGSVAAGKSSTLQALRCFTTHEEWSGRVPAEMYQRDKTLTKEQQAEVDKFLFPQLSKKNRNMQAKWPSIRIMDRAYLDLFAFSKDTDEVIRKATILKEENSHLEEGQIYFLTASEDSFKERLAKRGVPTGEKREILYDPKSLLEQEEELKKIYRPAADVLFDTSETTIGETARKIARKILLGEYSPFNFSGRLDEILRTGEP